MEKLLFARMWSLFAVINRAAQGSSDLSYHHCQILSDSDPISFFMGGHLFIHIQTCLKAAQGNE